MKNQLSPQTMDTKKHMELEIQVFLVWDKHKKNVIDCL
jgi:hypothetical protein